MTSARRFSDGSEFVIRGIVDGRPSVARWSRGRLLADPELMRRAEVVVAMGETFTGYEGLPDVVASLDGAQPAVLLTVMRAFSRVTSVEVAVE